jgi:hypothetical protein
MRGDVFPNFEQARRRRRFGPGLLGRKTPTTPQPVEPLERRVHLSYSASQDTTLNVLTLTGDGNGDTLHVYEVDNSPNDLLKVEVNGTLVSTWTLDADLTKVKVLAAGGADDVEFGTNFWGWLGGDEDVSIQAVVYGGDGNAPSSAPTRRTPSGATTATTRSGPRTATTSCTGTEASTRSRAATATTLCTGATA